MAATLDQLTNGRAEIVVSFGNISMLPQHGVDTSGMKPLSRGHRGPQVMDATDTGAVTVDGEFFKHTGLWTLARPVQENLPIKLGARAARAFEVGGELFDGVHQAIGTSGNVPSAIKNARNGAEKAGRNIDDLDLVLAGDGRDGGFRRGQGDGAHHGRFLPLRDAGAAAEPSRHQRRRPEADFRCAGAGDVAKALELDDAGAR